MRLSIFHMKLIHTLVFAVLSACVVYTLYSGIFNHVTHWTWLAVVIVLGEGIILKANGWRCPLTTVAEKLGAASGSVTDIFLPKWFADRVFSICGITFTVACILVVARWLAR